MTPQRLSREQSREQTRVRLLEAARVMFTKKSFASSSVEDISAAAGYTRGAFYSNFSGKTELFIELLRRHHDEITLEFDRIFELGASDHEALKNALVHYYSQLYRDDLCNVLWMEAKLVATRDAKFRNKLNVLLLEKRAKIVEFVKAFAAHTGLVSHTPPELLALGLMALADGVSSLHRIDPSHVDSASAEATLAWFCCGAMFGQAPAGAPLAPEPQVRAQTHGARVAPAAAAAVPSNPAPPPAPRRAAPRRGTPR
jgi:AcrR family transcriptional regulator